VNPNITGIIGSLASILGIGSSLVSQGINLHRQLHPPQQQAQVLQQQCPPTKGKLEVIITPTGQRQLVCVEQDSE
jgi:hypothetical protein